MGLHRLGPLLLPVLYVQGRRVRRTVPRLPEPDGERRGTRADGSRRAPLRLLIVGDSAAAGVGAATQDEALLGRLVARLAHYGPVAWRLEARTGVSTAGALRHLRAIEADPVDVAITSLGLNDVTRGRPVRATLADLVTVVDLLRSRFGARRVIVCGVPPVGSFPALPEPLRGWLGRRARALDAAIAAWTATRDDAEHLPLDFALDASAMASDGFHPGPVAYEAWATALAARIRAWRFTSNAQG